MRTTQIIGMCLCNVAIYIGIAAFVGIMPVYLTHLGASSTQIGLVLALAYLCLATSMVVAGRITDRLQRRKAILLLSGASAAPIAWLTGTTTTVGPLLLLTGILWFMTGIAMAMVTAIAGLCADATRRGRLFGQLTVSGSLGLLLGNLLSGPVVDRWGYPALFTLLAVVYVGLPGAGLLVPDRHVGRGSREGRPSSLRAIAARRPFLVICVASIVGQASNIVIVLSRTLIMHSLRFDATAITVVAALGSVVTLPLPLLAGRVANRRKRKPILLACFVSTPLGLLVLTSASAFWQFWTASALQTIMGVSLVVGSALVSDLFPEETRGTALALWNATPWMGIVLGLSGGGLAISLAQMRPTLVMSVVLSVVALLLLVSVSIPHLAGQEHTVVDQRGDGVHRRPLSTPGGRVTCPQKSTHAPMPSRPAWPRLDLVGQRQTDKHTKGQGP